MSAETDLRELLDAAHEAWLRINLYGRTSDKSRLDETLDPRRWRTEK